MMAVDQIARMMAMDAAQQGSTTDAYTKAETDALLDGKADLIDGKVPAAQLPNIPQVTVDQTYNAQSANAQSGVAVAEAIASVPTPTQIMGTITLNQNYTGITSLTQYGNIVILKLQIYPELNNVTIAGPANTELATFTGINNLPRWTNKVYLDYGTGQQLVDIYVNSTNNKILLWNKGSSFVWAGGDINLALSTTFVFPV